MFYQAKVLEPLGAVTSGSQFLEPDGNTQILHIFFQLIIDWYFVLKVCLGSGMFPNHIPNPEDKTAMKAITKAVLDNEADLGIIFDTDVDRYFIFVSFLQLRSLLSNYSIVDLINYFL